MLPGAAPKVGSWPGVHDIWYSSPGLPLALAAPAVEARGGGGRATHQGRLELQGDGPQGIFQLLLPGDVHDHHLGGLAQLPNIPPHDLTGGGATLRPEALRGPWLASLSYPPTPRGQSRGSKGVRQRLLATHRNKHTLTVTALAHSDKPGWSSESRASVIKSRCRGRTPDLPNQDHQVRAPAHGFVGAPPGHGQRRQHRKHTCAVIQKSHARNACRRGSFPWVWWSTDKYTLRYVFR